MPTDDKLDVPQDKPAELSEQYRKDWELYMDAMFRFILGEQRKRREAELRGELY